MGISTGYQYESVYLSLEVCFYRGIDYEEKPDMTELFSRRKKNTRKISFVSCRQQIKLYLRNTFFASMLV